MAEALFANNFHEESIIATQWIASFSNEFEKGDFEIFGKWLCNYLDNWAKIDDFCLRVTYPFMVKYPEMVHELPMWAKSDNLWMKRASAVSFITTSKSKYVTSHPFAPMLKIVKILLQDEEGLVLKGYGWLLKAASDTYQKEVFKFIMENKQNMPRTALRYAVENLPDALRTKVFLS